MSLSELTYYGRQDSELLNLTQVEAARPLTFQFDPVKSAVAFFMAETLRKCIAPGQEDESIYDFIEEWVLALETNDNIAVLPLTFLIASSETFGFKPLCEEENAAYFNIDAGMFQHTSSQGDRCRNGAGVDLIRDLINERDFGSPQKEVREQALEIMLEYFRIHIPRFETLDSYDIVKEVLSV